MLFRSSKEINNLQENSTPPIFTDSSLPVEPTGPAITGSDEIIDSTEDPSATSPKAVLLWAKEPPLEFDSFFSVSFPPAPQYFPGTNFFVPNEYVGYPSQHNKDSNYSANAVGVRRDNKVGFYDYDGNELMPCALSIPTRVIPQPNVMRDDNYICRLVDSESNRVISDDFRTLTNYYANHDIAFPQDTDAEVCVQNGKIGLWSWQDVFVEIDTSILPEHVMAKMLDDNGKIEAWCIIKNGTITDQRFPAQLHAISFINNKKFFGRRDYNDCGALFDIDTGQQLTDYIYTGLYGSSEGYSVLQIDNRYYVLVDEYGNEICDWKFDHISAVYEGKAYVELDGKIGILDVNKTARENVKYSEMEGAIGELTVLVNNLRIRKEANKDSASLGYVINGKTYPVFETSTSQSYTWYRIGLDKWVADNGSWIEYHKK